MAENTIRVKTPEGYFTIKETVLVGEDQLPLSDHQRVIHGGGALLTGIAADISVPFFMNCVIGITMGLNWWQLCLWSFFGQLAAGALCVTNDWGARRFAINFPVQGRAPFGINGTKGASLLRSFVAYMWFAITTWVMCVAVDQAICLFSEGYAALLTDWGRTMIWYVIALFGQYGIMHFGYRSILRTALVGGPICAATMLIAVLFSVHSEGTWGPVFETKEYTQGASLAVQLSYFVMVVGIMVAHWTNISDMARSMKSRKDTFLYMGVGAAIGNLCSAFLAATAVSLSIEWGLGIQVNVVYWIAEYPNIWMAAIMLLLVIAGAVTSNPALNLIPAVVTLANMFPRKLNFQKASVVVSIIALFTFPWIISDSSSVYQSFLNIIGGWNGALGAVVCCDYYFVRKKKIDFPALYDPVGRYRYGKIGVNWYAFVAFACGAIMGLLIPSYAFFVGAGTAIIVYKVITMAFPNETLKHGLAIGDDVPVGDPEE